MALDVQVKSVTVYTDPNNTEQTTTYHVMVPSGRFAVSGGWTVPAGELNSYQTPILSMRPLSATEWEFRVRDTMYPEPTAVTLYVSHANSTVLGLPL